MRLYAFSAGRLRVKPGIFRPGNNERKRYEVPVPCFLITHPMGNVLVDTGLDPVIGESPQEYWGSLTRTFEPVITKEEFIVNQLKKLEIASEEIDYIIMSHLHMDHASALRYFPYTNIIVNEKEMEAAQKDGNEKSGYFRRDWDYPLPFQTIDGEKDLFGDGTILIEPMPGHTPGMQIVIAQLGKETIVLASDAAASMDTITNGFVPQNVIEKEAYQKAVDRLKTLYESGAQVICGHDSKQWEQIKKAPDYYGES